MKTWWQRLKHCLWRQGFNVPASWWPEPPYPEHIDGQDA